MVSWRDRIKKPFGGKASAEEIEDIKEEAVSEVKESAADSDEAEPVIARAVNLGEIANKEQPDDEGEAEDKGPATRKIVGLEELENVEELDGEATDTASLVTEKVSLGEESGKEEMQPSEDSPNLFENATEGASEAKSDEAGDSLADLFSQEDEEENPLSGLINSLPDISAKELIDEAQDLTTIVRKWQQG